METKTITIRVDAEVVQAYESASEEERRKLDVLLNIKLRQATGNKRPLKQIMDEISDNAQNRGLTPEILDSILNEP